MNTGSLDDFHRRSRLISLVYEVLRNMELPADGATERAMCSILSKAFADKAIALPNLEAVEPRARHKSPMEIYLTLT
jgi:hypothetical protein